MAIGIRCADKVNTVSRGYSKEILLPSNPEIGFIGGEGLESFLQNVSREGRFFGILNGCVYPDEPMQNPIKFDVEPITLNDDINH